MDSPFLREILVPVDFGPPKDDSLGPVDVVVANEQRFEINRATTDALKFVARLAEAMRAHVRLLHITPSLRASEIYTGPISVPGELLDELDALARETAFKVVVALRDRHCTKIPVEVIVRPGRPCEGILHEARRKPTDLIVMAASGHSRFSRL